VRSCVRASVALLRARSGYGSTRRCTGYRGDPTWNVLTRYLSTSVRQLRRDRHGGSAPFRRNRGAPWKNEPDPRSTPRARPVSRDSYCIIFSPPPVFRCISPPARLARRQCRFLDRPLARLWFTIEFLRQMRDILCRAVTSRGGCYYRYPAAIFVSRHRTLRESFFFLFLFFPFPSFAKPHDLSRHESRFRYMRACKRTIGGVHRLLGNRERF